MNVASYIFQSPSPSPVQVGRLDPSSVSTDGGSTPSAPVVNETQTEAKNFQAAQVQEVTPSVKEKPLLDIYV